MHPLVGVKEMLRVWSVSVAVDVREMSEEEDVNCDVIVTASTEGSMQIH